MLSDRIDRQKLLLAIALIGIFGALLMPLVTKSFVAFSMLLSPWGGLIGGSYPIGLALLGSRFGGVDLASANAAFIMFYSLGMLSGPPLLGAAMDLLPRTAWRSLWRCCLPYMPASPVVAEPWPCVNVLHELEHRPGRALRPIMPRLDFGKPILILPRAML